MIYTTIAILSYATLAATAGAVEIGDGLLVNLSLSLSFSLSFSLSLSLSLSITLDSNLSLFQGELSLIKLLYH